jgi:hypothetical protein
MKDVCKGRGYQAQDCRGQNMDKTWKQPGKKWWKEPR